MFCVGWLFARGQNLGENEFRLNVANYECGFLQEYLRGINMSGYRQGRVSQVWSVGRCRSYKPISYASFIIASSVDLDLIGSRVRSNWEDQFVFVGLWCLFVVRIRIFIYLFLSGPTAGS